MISIIGILMGLLFPAVNGALDSARKAQAKNDVTQIATAITAYEAEYGRLPSEDTNVPQTDKTVDAKSNGILGALIAGGDSNRNPRRITFLEVQDVTGKRGRSGLSGGSFVDPWGSVYQISLDYDYDNQLTGVGTNNTNVTKKVAVWNVPAKQSNSTAAQQSRRYVTSWE